MEYPIVLKIEPKDEMNKTADDIERSLSVLNGIYHFIKRDGWLGGYRNNMAVDLSIACRVLDICIGDVLDATDNMTSDDMLDANQRVTVIADYLDTWNHASSGILSYMCDEDYWTAVSAPITRDMKYAVLE